MPSLYTHNLFAKDVMKHLDKKISKNINKTNITYDIFSQSFDMFFYYRYFFFGKAKKIRDFGLYCQVSNTQSFLINLIRNIIKNNLENNPEILACLYGIITHYVLDTTCHPFVFYKTGEYIKNDKNTNKYNGTHEKMEIMIDAYLYQQNTNSPFYKYKFINELIPKLNFSNDLITILNKTYKDTYHKDNMGAIYYQSTKWARFMFRLCIYDLLGIKKFMYRIFDFFTPFKKGKYQFYSFHIKNIDTSYLNLDHKQWNHPSSKNMTFTLSFIDLYNKSIETATNIITEVDKVLNKEKDIKELIKIIPNISYATGLPIIKNAKMKYFEY